MSLLEIDGVGKRFGGFAALTGIEIAVREGERLGLIGPNGSGKSTLVNCISGVLKNDSGKIVFGGTTLDGLPAWRRTRLGIARSFQIPRPFSGMTVLQNLQIPVEYSGRSGGEDLGELLRLVGLQDKAQARSAGLNQIELRKLELARAIAAGPRLLIADEAMAGLSHAEVDEILDLLFKLNERGITIIMIEHIMRAVMRFSQRIVVLDAGRKIADGLPDEIIRNPAVEKAYLGE
jgi:branched-chain amino acid transport system ATP-binding protein